MFRWLEGPGAAFRNPLPNSTNYLGAYGANGELLRAAGRSQAPEIRKNEDADAGGVVDPDKEPSAQTSEVQSADQSVAGGAEKKPGSTSELPPARGEDLRPFPLNRQFVSQKVLSEEFREEIWRRVTKDGKNVKVVSAEMGVEMNRVGAVVRLKTIEKEWTKMSYALQTSDTFPPHLTTPPLPSLSTSKLTHNSIKGKPLATPYARATLAMLPQTIYNPKFKPRHEPINDLPTHAATVQQIFHPTSESRAFTRADAAKVFDRTLLPADERIPHPELVVLEKEVISGLTKAERNERMIERARVEAEAKEKKERRRKEREEREIRVVEGRRWEFRFRDVSVEDAGKDGRGERGVGWRYGIPHEDRKKGQVRIPTRVG
ncbi:MAG: hypothetical protein M1835_005181 [Candelina submexicana]|nr:MAG: hypothetical protein M1835_005181 [Candelina submexicana]